MSKGSVRSFQKCPQCGNEFTYLPFEEGLVCIPCKRAPTRFYLYVRDFFDSKRPARIYTDIKGRVFKHFDHAQEQLEAMRKQEPFNPADWLPKSALFYQIRPVEDEKTQRKKLKDEKNIVKIWLDDYDIDVRNLEKTAEYLRHVKQYFRDYIIPYFDGFDIRDIKKPHLKAFKNLLFDKDLSHSTIRHILVTLKAFLQDHIEIIKVMPEFPVIGNIPKKQKKWMGYEEQLKVLEKIPEKHRLLFEVIFESTIRQGEARALQMQCLQDGELIVFMAFSGNALRPVTKNKLIKTRKLSYSLYRKLIEHSRNLKSDDFLFTIDGHPYGEERIRKIWRRACKDAHVDYIPPHMAVRHSAATRIMEEFKEKAKVEIMKRLGHKDKESQKPYVLDVTKKL